MPPTTNNQEEEEEEEVAHHNIIIDNEDEDDDEEDLEEEEDDNDNDNEDDDEEEETNNPVTTTTSTNPKLELTFETTQQTPIKQEEEQEKKPTTTIPFDDSRRLFQRLWTDEDEIGLLQGFLEYTSQRGGFKNSAYHHDTAPFYDQIKSKLQLDFNKNQLVEKLRRLKKKYRNVMNRISSGKEISFKTPHDQATFEISRKIWNEVGVGVGVGGGIDDDDGNVNMMSDAINGTQHVVFNAEKKVGGSSSRSRKRARTGSAIGVGGEENVTDPVNLMNCTVNSSVPSVIEDTVRSCLSPLFKELMASAINGPGNFRGFGGMGLNPFGGDSSSMLSFLSGGEKEVMDEKWRKQQILELEVYSKRVELVQDQIKLALEELRSAGSG